MYSRSDNDLLSASCGGEECAYEQLSERYRPRLLSYVEMLSSGKADSEAVVQEALIKAYTARHGFRGDSCVSTWLFTIARNEMYRDLRRKSTLPLEVVRVAVSEDPEEIVLRNERARAVNRAVGSLPRMQREAIVLTRYGGLNYAEAAKVLRTTEGAIQTAIYKGLKTIRKRMMSDE